MKKQALLLAPAAAAVCLGMAAAPAAHAADSSTSYQATLQSINGSGASGTFWLKLTGNQAVITEKTTGLAATFMGAPYPHVQHIHGGAMGMCPDMSADKNGDGVISTTEGAPHYGGIVTTLSTSGDTSPASGTNIKIAPSGGSYTYQRTITLDSTTIADLKNGSAVIVVHGLDPSKLSKQAQGEKSDLVPSLPLAATSPTLCGKVVNSQMSGMPTGGVQTGGGGTSGLQNAGLFYAAGVLALGAGGTLAARRKFGKQR
ncbi:hypothetical protein [Flexivirga alba]|uniref:CHRD domain-containing protein n=1 Tax=Flexivirga alba TaxID=702742 RepID=A0ABW2ACB0_9MICO